MNEGLENPVIHSTFGYAAQMVILDPESGAVDKGVAAHDVGRAVNPLLCEGQVEGAVHMGLGYAMSEGFPCDETGTPLNETLRSLDIVRPKDMPEVDVILVEAAEPNSPYGIKGVGEIGLVPTAGAVAAAMHANDGEWRTELPLVNHANRLYSALARGMPAPPRTPTGFMEILELVWWRLDRALDEDTIYWSAKLGALEALQRGCTAIIDHHESPNAIDGSLSIIADACAEVGVRVNCSYGVTDRHGAEGAARGLAENDRFLRGGGRGMVGLHAAFTCSDDTIAAAADMASRHGVGVHVHVAEGREDTWGRLLEYSNTNWWLVHGVYLPETCSTSFESPLLRRDRLM